MPEARTVTLTLIWKSTHQVEVPADLPEQIMSLDEIPQDQLDACTNEGAEVIDFAISK